MDKKSLFIIDEKAMLENFEDKTPKNAFENGIYKAIELWFRLYFYW